jgi:hypothetical protein
MADKDEDKLLSLSKTGIKQFNLKTKSFSFWLKEKELK